jgi:hypothetical protein
MELLNYEINKINIKNSKALILVEGKGTTGKGARLPGVPGPGAPAGRP